MKLPQPIEQNMTSGQQFWTSKLNYRECPLCGSKDHQVVSRRMQHDLNLTTVICKKCSFVFTNPVPGNDTLDRFYSEAYYEYYGDIAGSITDKEKSVIPPAIGQKIKWIEDLVHLNGKRLLEIGPGNGLFLWWASQKGADVLGIEPSIAFVNILEREKIPHRAGTFENIDWHENEKFDLVALFHSLEHILEPNQTLIQIREILADNGLVAIEVPNILKPFRSLDNFFLRYVHTSNFSVFTLSSFLGKHGFQILFVDEGIDNWRHPQNIFVIAKKTNKPEITDFSADWKPVRRQMNKYRVIWLLWYKWLWLFLPLLTTLKHLARKILYLKSKENFS